MLLDGGGLRAVPKSWLRHLLTADEVAGLLSMPASCARPRLPTLAEPAQPLSSGRRATVAHTPNAACERVCAGVSVGETACMNRIGLRE